jgi:hydroxymethylpyrimidine/phosphomethylpyrimidine kinase
VAGPITVGVSRSRALTVAGSDPSGGAGLQADLAVFSAFGCHGMAVVSGLTVQDSRGVREVAPVDPDLVDRQVRGVAEDCPPAAAKSGMLPSARIVERLAARIRSGPAFPWVIDPVAASGGGARLCEPEAERAVWTTLVPLGVLVTPNALEAESASGVPVRDLEGALKAARRLVALGAAAVLVKGGHVDGAAVVDVLLVGDGVPVVFERPRVFLPRRVHGTGCALSAAIAAGLARGLSLADAVRLAGDWVHAALRGAYEAGGGALSLDRSVRVPGMPS